MHTHKYVHALTLWNKDIHSQISAPQIKYGKIWMFFNDKLRNIKEMKMSYIWWPHELGNT